MAGEVGIDSADRHGGGLFLRSAGGPEQRSADARETVGLDGGHGFSSFDARAGERVLLVVFWDPWSQSDRPIAMTPGRNLACVQRNLIASVLLGRAGSPAPRNPV